MLSNHDSSRSTARSYTVLVRVMEFRAFFNYTTRFGTELTFMSLKPNENGG